MHSIGLEVVQLPHSCAQDVVIATLLLFWGTVNAVEEDRLLHIRIEVDIIERGDFIVVEVKEGWIGN